MGERYRRRIRRVAARCSRSCFPSLLRSGRSDVHDAGLRNPGATDQSCASALNSFDIYQRTLMPPVDPHTAGLREVFMFRCGNIPVALALLIAMTVGASAQPSD